MIQLSPSAMAVFKTCRRQYWLRYLRKLAPHPAYEKQTGPAPLGTRVHLALEGWYAHGLDPLAVVDAVYDLACDDHPFHEDDLRKEQDWARIMVAGYVQWAAREGFDEVARVIEVEQVVQEPLDVPGDEPVLMTGRIDQLVQRWQDGGICVLDHKTLGSMSKADNLDQNEQMLTYALLMSLRLKREPIGEHRRVSGAYFNMILRSKRTARAAGPFYRRDYTSYNVHQLNGMWTRLHEEAAQVAQMARRIEAGQDPRAVAYPTPGTHCDWCPFQRVCPLFDDGSRAEDMVSAQFVEADPWGYRTTGTMDRVRAMLGPRSDER